MSKSILDLIKEKEDQLSLQQCIDLNAAIEEYVASNPPPGRFEKTDKGEYVFHHDLDNYLLEHTPAMLAIPEIAKILHQPVIVLLNGQQKE